MSFPPRIKKSPHTEVNHNADAKDSGGGNFYERQEMMHRSKLNDYKVKVRQITTQDLTRSTVQSVVHNKMMKLLKRRKNVPIVM